MRHLNLGIEGLLKRRPLDHIEDGLNCFPGQLFFRENSISNSIHCKIENVFMEFVMHAVEKRVDF